ncbi:polysaccharide deacetylase family protein [Anoxynatronum buryatiense]|uniref:Peptidoglycan/xylan/chitin deacetylase, PgdA/CDA1 family n=1 Tax=Anoxynatronum buryatiense TaxID=489973 RepID=A0AA45WTC3_9CLOT|nr:polysaccharide deacetylase family protein [Anoxynatronum buryatiense]SMP41250.1 Peptidoglycan/xylan/chitin deacetylase, PgdA/CDA1 family [Anoxynatronum buryatiense]
MTVGRDQYRKEIQSVSDSRQRTLYRGSRLLVLIFLLILGLGTSGMLMACSDASDTTSGATGNPLPGPATDEGAEAAPVEDGDSEEAAVPESTASEQSTGSLLQQIPVYEAADPASVEADELGQIMVLMYHHIREPEAEWSRTPENFRKDLEVLYEQGFRPIRLIDYARGQIHVPAGKTPVVFTFDDGNDNNFNMIEDETGEWIIDPDCAVGILMAFHEAHPDFRPHATFFINGGTPFGQSDWVDFKLNYLVTNGMDIGNHTETHLHLGDASAEQLQQELGRIQQLVNRYVDDYQVNTFALPFGSRPSSDEVAPYVESGTYQEVTYVNEAVLEVGWDPYHSPFNRDFNPLKIRRVRASETKVDGVGMYDWLATFESGSRRRFISDGDPNTIAIPDSRAELLREDLEGYEILLYEAAP